MVVPRLQHVLEIAKQCLGRDCLARRGSEPLQEQRLRGDPSLSASDMLVSQNQMTPFGSQLPENITF